MGAGIKFKTLSLLVFFVACLGEGPLISAQESRSAGAGTLSSLVRALGNSPRSSPFSARSANARSLPFSLPPSREPKESPPPTLQSKFAPSPQPGRSRFAPAERPPAPKPTRFESSAPPTSKPAARGNSEFRFGSNRPRPSSRITFIPQDRGERFNRRQKTGGLAAKLSSLPAPRTTTKRPTTTKAPATKKPNNPYEYVYDEYYDDYYYYDDDAPTNEAEKKKNQPVNLGPIDPPVRKEESVRPTQSKPKKPAPTPQVGQMPDIEPKVETGSRAGISLADRLAGLGPKQPSAPQQSVNEVDFSRNQQPSLAQFEPPTPPPPTKTTTASRVEVRVSNTSEKTFVVANIQTSRSVSMREESNVDNTTPFAEEEATVKPEETLPEESSSDNIPPRPSLTSLFGNIDVSANEAREGRAENNIEDISASPEPKIIDITTEAHRLSTTEKSSVSSFLDKIFEQPAEIDASKLPPGFSLEKATTVGKSTTSTAATEASTTVSTTEKVVPTKSQEDILFEKIFGGAPPATPSPDLLPKGFAPTKEAEIIGTDEQDASNNLEKEKASQPTEKTSSKLNEDLLFERLFGKSDSATPSADLLPKGFKLTTEKTEETSPPKKFNVPIGKPKPVPASLLPKGFNSPEGSATTESAVKTTTTAWGTSKGPGGLIFPVRNNRPSFLTTTTTQKPGEPSTTSSGKRTYVNLFERVKTTTPAKPTQDNSAIKNFIAAGLGIPIAVPTTPPPTTQSTTTSSTSTTTTTTVPTTTAIPTTTVPGVCGEKCRLFATIRITEGAEWVPELKNRDTKEWQALAKLVKSNLNAIYQRSRLNRWYTGLEIDSFNPGSVLVDYIVQLNDVSTELDTVDLKNVMNGMLKNTNQVGHRLGPMKIDPNGTDFVVIKQRQRSVITDDGSYLIPEWLIAVIVISLASFLFIIIFGLVVLVSRARVRRRNVPLTEEVLNKLNANQLAAANNGYHHDAVYDMDAIWNEKLAAEANMKPPSSRGRGYNPNYNINIYDSWRTDWSGPYGSSATYAKRRPEANF